MHSHVVWFSFNFADVGNLWSWPCSDPSTGAFVPGNGGSLEKCRRRWDLADNQTLKYRYLNAFDRAMQHLDKAFGFVNAPHTWVSRKDEGDKMIVAERGDLVLVFNFHPTQSYSDYRVGAYKPGPYKVVPSAFIVDG